MTLRQWNGRESFGISFREQARCGCIEFFDERRVRNHGEMRVLLREVAVVVRVVATMVEIREEADAHDRGNGE